MIREIVDRAQWGHCAAAAAAGAGGSLSIKFVQWKEVLAFLAKTTAVVILATQPLNQTGATHLMFVGSYHFDQYFFSVEMSTSTSTSTSTTTTTTTTTTVFRGRPC